MLLYNIHMYREINNYCLNINKTSTYTYSTDLRKFKYIYIYNIYRYIIKALYNFEFTA